MVFLSTKVADIGHQDNQALLFICIWLNQANRHLDSSAMTDYRCKFSTLDWHCKLKQFGWQNMSPYLRNETYYWRKQLLMHLNWTIYNACGLNNNLYVCCFPTLSQDRDRPIPIAQAEACPQRRERPVWARSPHRSRNGYPGWNILPRHVLLLGYE